MLDGNLFDKLEAVARRVRGSDLPFGGIQLILCGDFFQVSRSHAPVPLLLIDGCARYPSFNAQLPPVTKSTTRGEHAVTTYAFQAASWSRSVPMRPTTFRFEQSPSAREGDLLSLPLVSGASHMWSN